MSGDHYPADTNTFIYLLNRHPALQGLLESEWSYSFVTEIELLGKYRITNAELSSVESLLTICIKISHSEKIGQYAIRLRQQFKIKLPDALIAATAIVCDIPLLTFDKGFANIPALDLVLLDF